jgi:glyoxylase-like metal-dependent hydrolase (beta-lactamase superfamily II)
MRPFWRESGLSDLYLKQLQVGPMQNFVYLVGSRSARQCWVVDPAWDIEAITAAAAADDMRITGALVTHYHPDHCGGHLWGHDIAGVAEMVAAAKIPVYANTAEIDGLVQVTGLERTDFHACRGGDKLTLGGVELTTIHTPGHTPGSQCFLADGALVSGDTLFISACGRVDLPGGDPQQMYESLTGTLAKLPTETVVYPGHHYDPQTSLPLAAVMARNPFLSASSFGEWRRHMGV